tara:strand:+ start:6857 stop:8653 length:1797 start_codon:yes stop_codon:yes gene_type:complete
MFSSDKKAKVMFVNPIVGVDEGVLPMGPGILIGGLRQIGHTVKLFDTTKYKIVSGHREGDHGPKEINEKYLNFVPVTEGYKLKPKPMMTEQEVLDQFDYEVNEFKPDVIAITVLCSHNWGMTKLLMNRCTYKGAKVILGGKHIFTMYKEVIKVPWVDAVCIGDGEISLPIFVNRIAEGKDYKTIGNLWTKIDGEITENRLNSLLRLDNTPYPDWTDFDERLFYKPFRGRMYKYGYVEISRGCPFRCPYCHNEKEHDLFAGLGRFMRNKPIKTVCDEIRFMQETYGIEIIKFLDEEFLAKPKKYLTEFAAEYKKLNLPFLIAVRPERMTKKNAKLLADMGCVQASVGVESGNEYIRKEIYKRGMDNEVMIEGFRNFREAGINTTSLNMIGGPYEDAEMIFDTIELNRHLKADDVLCSVFQPYRGTSLRDLCIKEGFMDDKEECEETTLENSVLTMPQITNNEIWGFRRTFALYIRAPKWLYPVIGLYRKWDNTFTRFIFKILSKKYGNRNGVTYVGHGGNGRGWTERLSFSKAEIQEQAQKRKEMFIDYEQSIEFAGGFEDLSQKEFDKVAHKSQTKVDPDKIDIEKLPIFSNNSVSGG